MSKQHKKVKLSQRLQQIETLICQPYTHIWDCCCDHGLLGLSLLNKRIADTVHFVDIVPELLTQIEHRLKVHWQGDPEAWKVHCLDAGDLPLRQYLKTSQQDKHLIIIAGIGGDLMIRLLKSLQWVWADYQVEFILCPVHHHYKVRQYLMTQHFALINEALVFENKRGYQVLHVSVQAKQSLTAVGSIMWDLSNEQHRNYLKTTIAHYQRIANNSDADVDSIIKDYQGLYLLGSALRHCR